MKSRLRAFGHALRGIREFFADGIHAKLHAAAAVFAIGAGVAMGLTPTEWLVLSLTIALVLTAEAINTAIERLADEVTLEHSEGIRRVKDIAAGAVLISALNAVVVGGVLVASRW